MCPVMSNSATPWTVAHQASLSKGFPRQEYWSGLLCPPAGNLPDPEIEPVPSAPAALRVDSLPRSHWEGPAAPTGLLYFSSQGLL